MKKYLVIGDPIDHSLSPQLHNYWLKTNNIKGVYNKQKSKSSELKDLISKVRKHEINGINVTVPFKKEVITHMDKLSTEAEITQSVNTIYLEDNKIIGHNTDIEGFEFSIKESDYKLKGKKIFILGAGGVVPSIIFSLNKMKVSNITISNRTIEKAETLKDTFKNIHIVNWGKVPYFDMIINATSLGLSDKNEINLDFSQIEGGKFFYDVIYNPKETKFLKKAKEMKNETENGEKMFIYQAAAAFNIWHGIYPKIDGEVKRLLEQ
tara:strand:+ start:626 stop:1420 length:795 start_codon:yes stop_codon:yes gene_type:complete